MEIADSVLDLIGNTPMVRLRRLAASLPCPLVAKLETTNPGGSVKDRPAVAMIDAAERAGLLRPGGTIVEPTSGNTGVGLAIVAAQRGYRCIFVMTDKVSPEKVSLLRAYGAEVIVCPVAVPPEDPGSYYSVAERLVREVPGAYRPNQYANPANPASHEATTGPEIWRQTDGRVTHFVAGAGTGGTLTGVGRHLKARNPTVRIIAADPEGSVYSGGSGRPYLVEGIGEDFWPVTYDPSVVDEVVAVSDRDSFLMARRVAREEGLLIGGSCGTAVAAALRVAERCRPGDLVVVLLPDSGRGYLSRVFNDEWLARYGFLQAEGVTVSDILAARAVGDIPPLVYVYPEATVRDAILTMRKGGLSQMPVAKGAMPLAAAEVMGSVDELQLMEWVFLEGSALDRPVEDVMSPALPTIGSGQPVGLAVQLLESANALLVLDGGRPQAVLARTDVLTFLSTQHSQTLPRLTVADQGRRELGDADTSGASGASGAASGAAQAGFETRAIHVGQPPDERTGAVNVPVFLSSTFAQDGVGGTRGGYEYGRTGNPTRSALEAVLASLEGARFGRAFASGLAAEDALLRLLDGGQRVVLGSDAYGGTFRLIDKVFGRAGVGWSVVDLTDPGSLDRAWPDGAALLWVETPTNPTLTVVDVAALAEVAHRHGARLAVDNTFATPYLQLPLDLGADVVVHSTTKYLSGHSDVVGGFVATNDEELAAHLAFVQNAVGAVPGPFDCYLTLRGVKTLAVRMDRHCANAAAVADALAGHRAVERVLYPGFTDHIGHAVATKQIRDYGGMVSFLLRGGRDAAHRVVARTKVFTLAESLGAVESLIEHPGAMTHASVAGSPLQVDDALVRLSVGLETADDLVTDLRQALAPEV